MIKSHKYRIYPTHNQSELLNKHIGSCRFVYNLALEVKQSAYAGNKINVTCFDLIRQLPELKEECEWLKEINSQSLAQSIRNIEKAYSRFFSGKSNYPKFKKRTGVQSFNAPQKVYIQNGKLSIPKFREGIKIIQHIKIAGEIRQATISKTPTGKYFASIMVDDKKNIPDKKTVTEETSVGVDLGLISFLADSRGHKVDNPRFLKKNLSRLKYIQRKYSNKKSKTTKRKLSALHEKITNQRKDFLHKTSSMLIKNHDSICIETLNINGMVKNRTLSRHILDAGWGEFIRQLEYKSKWAGKNLIRIGLFDPSSKTCSNCGGVNNELTLSDREWNCVDCQTLLDRDVNAAINIKKIALKNHLSVERRLKNRNELPALVGVTTSEVNAIN